MINLNSIGLYKLSNHFKSGVTGIDPMVETIRHASSQPENDVACRM